MGETNFGYGPFVRHPSTTQHYKILARRPHDRNNQLGKFNTSLPSLLHMNLAPAALFE